MRRFPSTLLRQGFWRLPALILSLALLPAAVWAGPRDVLQGHTPKTTGGASAAGKTEAAAPKQRPKVIINTDGLHSTKVDQQLMQQFKDALEKRGVETTISPYCGKPNNHIQTIRNCPKGSWVVSAASGICAGTYRDLVLGIRGKQGYLRKPWQDNDIKGLIILNLSPYLLQQVKFLPRAWDDKFSPASFKGLDKPYAYLTQEGKFHVAESAQDNKPAWNAKRVPVLADQIARIVGGTVGPAATTTGKTGTSSAGFLLRREGKSDNSQDKALVRQLQRALQAMGLYRGCLIDGWFGPYTQLAVMEYQREHDLNVTGTVDQKLFAAILQASRAKAAAQVPAGMQSFLTSSRNAPVTDSRIKAKAAALKGATPMETVKKAFAFVQAIPYKAYMNTRHGAVGTLTNRNGNCVDQSHLLVALLRAAGVPARYAHCTSCQFSSMRVGHVWVEAYVNGAWVALDPTSSRNGVGVIRSFRALTTTTKKRELDF